MYKNLAAALAAACFFSFLSPTTPAHAESAARQKPVKAAFVYVSPVADAGWTHQHEAGRKEMMAALGDKAVQSTFVENVAEGADSERVIRDLAASGNDIIFTPSFGYMEPTMRVAQEFPNVRFESITGYKRAANVSTANARYYEGRYLSGVLAGRMSRSGVAGFVAGFPIPEVMQGINAFTLGMRSVNPKAVVKVIWLDAWFDPPKEREAAMALFNEGVDVVSFQVASTAIMAAAQERGRYAIGYHSNMRHVGPDAQLVAITHQWGKYYADRVKAVADGSWKSQDTWGGVREGMIRMDGFSPKIPQTVREEVKAREKEMIAGKLQPFQAVGAPIRDNLGAVRIEVGRGLKDEEILTMNWLVEGVQAPRRK
ncbi:BMP family ABC transporter substrate-binding protein [Diaphorobacter ruginosibacter]|uniref:BMP family ABC transporter substrate-binding protein n=1 Tax=Diaphorobacter ruginosibacter TaxID=1715720 RepID=A0A7G9RKU7_9BURK|nr:BMP family ABC transporter substrate-binding protein [Diaphorobacter ruginosibacter]QNN56222.1 BMP family ABC transporter substrate-binding protein [Diaphorobacter ruginosibacter]